jgi:hypothetical protein
MLNEYLLNVESKIEKISRSRESKVEKDVYKVVEELVSKNEPSTIKTICETLNKPPQQIHQLVKKSSILKKVKVKGRTLIVPSNIE